MDKLIKTLDKKQLPVLLVLISYMLQGVASLIYQVSWEQAMESTVGMALPTMAIIVCIFFLGMGLGAYVFSKAWLSPKWAGQLFIINQISLVLFGLVFVAIEGLGFICFLTTRSEQWLLLIYLLRIITLGLFLLVPAFFIGAAFPLLNKSKPLMSSSGKAEKLYLANLSGCLIGAILVGFIMLPNFGLVECTMFALLLNLFSLLLFALAASIPTPQVEAEIPQFILQPAQLNSQKVEIKQNGQKNKKLLVLAIMAAAFFNMILELLFMRLSVLFIGSSAFAFSLVCAMQLFALACGSLVANFSYKQKSENFWHLFVFLYFFASAWLFIEILFFPNLSKFISMITGFCINYLALSPFLSFFLSHSISLLLLMFVPCFCLGATLPFYFQLRHLYPQSVPIRSSYAYALNLFASVAGCFSGGVLVFPIFSTITDYAICSTFTLSAAAIFCVGLVLYIFGPLQNRENKLTDLYAAIIAIIVLGLCYWTLSKRPLLTNVGEIIFYKEGLNSTVSLSANEKENLVRLQTDGQTEATLPLNGSLPAVMSDETTQILLGLLPNVFSLHEPKTGFLLGFGSGVTAQAILANRELEELTAAELEPAVIIAAQRLQRYLPDRRLNIKIRDGRNLLSMLKHSYDIIVSQPGEPWRSSSRYLYTLEFWQLVKSRLRIDGVFCQWFPLYAIDKGNLLNLCYTFASVFPDTFVIRTKNAGELILLAFNSDSNRKTSEQAIISTMVENAIQRCKSGEIKRNLVRLGFDDLPALLSTFRLSPGTFKQWMLANKQAANEIFQFNKDNFPFVQYRLQSLILHRGISIDRSVDEAVPTNSASALSVSAFFLSYNKLAEDNFNEFSTVSERLKEAKQLIAKHDLTGAAICLNNVLEQQANNFEARFILGKIFCHLNKEQQGLLQIKRASKIDTKNAMPNLYVALLYALKNDWPMAQNNLLILEKKSCNDPDVRYLADQIRKRRKLDKNNSKIKLLMLKCHYPI